MNEKPCLRDAGWERVRGVLISSRLDEAVRKVCERQPAAPPAMAESLMPPAKRPEARAAA